VKRLDQIRQVLWLEAVASKALEQAGELRRTLQLDAEQDYRDTLSTKWAVQDVVTMLLPLSHRAIVVTDGAKFKAWVAQNHPAEIEHVTQVRPGFQKTLLETVADTDGEIVFMPGTGEVIPGLSVREGGTPRAITIKADPAAKAALAAYAEKGLERASLEAHGPVVLAEIEAGSAQ